MSNLITFPKTKERLTFEEMVSLVEHDSDIIEGVLIAFRRDGSVVCLNFGDITAMKALWLARNLEENALYRDSEDEDGV